MTTLALCARAVGWSAKDIQSVDGTREGWTPKVPAQGHGLAAVTKDSLVDGSRHGLPGRSLNGGCSTSRSICERMNDIAARRNGRCLGTWPNGP